MKLRNYQIECINSIFEHLRSGKNEVLSALSTGAGKGVIFQELIKLILSMGGNKQIVVLFNRNDLLEQINERLNNAGINSVIYNGNTKNIANVICASVESFKKIVNELIINVLIIDETHNVNFEEGSYKTIIDEARIKNNKIKIIGFTATPYRHDGYIYGEGKLYPSLCYEKNMPWFIDNGFLVPFVYGAGRDSFDTKDLKIVAGDYCAGDLDKLTNDDLKIRNQVADALSRMRDRKKIVWFCCNIKHAEKVYNELLRNGDSARIIHSKQKKDVRKQQLQDFTDSNYRHLVFITIVKEGFDHPPIDCIVLMRPTRQPGLYVQVGGRGARPYECKQNCLILDYGEVIKFLGKIDNPVLNFAKKSKRDSAKNQVMKVCPSCFDYVETKTKNCPNCDYEFKDEFVLSKSLTDTAFIAAKELSDTVKKVTLHTGTSKNGNEYLMIKYFISDCVIEDYVAEFFVWNSYHVMSAKQRLIKLGVKLRNNLIEQSKEIVTKLPTKVYYEINKKGFKEFRRCDWI